MRPLGDALHEHGYTVMGINLPGHATSEKDMARYGNREWLQAAIDAVAHMRLHCSTVAVCGLSMGAVLSLILAEKHLVDALRLHLRAVARVQPFTTADGHFWPYPSPGCLERGPKPQITARPAV